MRLLTTLRFGLLVTLPVAGAPFFLSACGGEEGACTTIGCASPESDQMMTGAGGGSGGASPSFIDPNDTSGSSAAGSGSLQGEACQEVTFSAQASPVNVLILLDRSTSMLELADRTVPGVTRWDAVTRALRAFVNSAEAGNARIGLQFFGLQNGNDDCAVPKYSLPAVPVAPLAQNRAALIAAIDGTRPGSLTPTAPAVAGALEYALQVAQLPENTEVPTVMILASDGIPSECGPTDASGQMVVSFREIIDTLRSYSVPPQDALGNPTRPSVRTYIVGTEELENNADALADAGGGEAFLVGGGATGGGDLEARFLDALLSIVVKPLSCIIDVPQTADDGAPVDFEKVRVRYTGSSSGLTTEFPRTTGPGGCGVDRAWFYENVNPPQKIFFCRAACDSLGAGDLQLELGCSPQMILR